MNRNIYVNPYNVISVVPNQSFCFLKIILQTNNSDISRKMRIKITDFNNSAEHEAILFLDWSYNATTQTYSRIQFGMNPNAYRGYNFKACRLDNVLYLFMKTSVSGEQTHVTIEQSNCQDYLFKNEQENNTIVWDQIIECTIPDSLPYTVASKVVVDTTYLDTSYFNKEFCFLNVALNINEEKSYQDPILTITGGNYQLSGILIGYRDTSIGQIFPIRSNANKELLTYGSAIPNIPVGSYRLIASGYTKGTRPTWE